MAYDRTQLRDLVRRVLMGFDPALASDVAIELVLGTIAQESAFGTYLRQVRGPALGAPQLEPATADWLISKYAPHYPELLHRHPDELEWDLRLGIILCRLRYFAVPAALPGSAEPGELAMYWKKHYNTYLGAGREEEFIDNYDRWVAERTI